MFCNHCGSPVAPEQTACPRCGSSIIGARAAVAARMRVAEHVHLLAIFWFVVAVFFIIPAGIMGVLAGVVTVPMAMNDVPAIARILGPALFAVLGFGFLAAAVVSFITGWGLLKVRPWGRTLALVMAFVALIHPPFGTALGIYTLFVLLPDAAGDEYRSMSVVAEKGEAKGA